MVAKAGKIAILFPGQGSQYVGMGAGFLETSGSARALMATAESISGLPVKNLCLDGPLEDLTSVTRLHPALTVVNLICWQALRDAGIKPDFVAGHSLGEYSALCAAEVLSVEDTLRLVTRRGELMFAAAGKNSGGMSAVLGLSIEEVREVLAALDTSGIVTIGNHNSEKQVVITGELEALKTASASLAEKGGKIVSLPVALANHSPLVEDAVPEFAEAMSTVAFNTPSIPVLFNVTAKEENDPHAVRAIMASQIASMVRWHEIMERLVQENVRIFIEAGPKKVLSGLVKRAVPKDYDHLSLQFDTPDSLGQCLQAIRDLV